LFGRTQISDKKQSTKATKNEKEWERKSETRMGETNMKTRLLMWGESK
jgi:hypothetical protein